MRIKPEIIIITIFAIASIVLRLYNEFWNFSILGGLAIYAGSRSKSFGLCAVLASRLASDLLLGFYDSILFDYTSYCVIFAMGNLLKPQKIWSIVASGILSSITFYLLSNFGVWYCSSMYSYDVVGIIRCYVMGLPFLNGTICGDLFSVVLIYYTSNIIVDISNKLAYAHN